MGGARCGNTGQRPSDTGLWSGAAAPCGRHCDTSRGVSQAAPPTPRCRSGRVGCRLIPARVTESGPLPRRSGGRVHRQSDAAALLWPARTPPRRRIVFRLQPRDERRGPRCRVSSWCLCGRRRPQSAAELGAGYSAHSPSLSNCETSWDRDACPERDKRHASVRPISGRVSGHPPSALNWSAHARHERADPVLSVFTAAFQLDSRLSSSWELWLPLQLDSSVRSLGRCDGRRVVNRRNGLPRVLVAQWSVNRVVESRVQ